MVIVKYVLDWQCEIISFEHFDFVENISGGQITCSFQKHLAPPFSLNTLNMLGFFFSAYTTFYSQEGALSMGVLYMADFTSRFYKAKGRQARPQMDSV